jgi:hypothetical protein
MPSCLRFLRDPASVRRTFPEAPATEKMLQHCSTKRCSHWYMLIRVNSRHEGIKMEAILDWQQRRIRRSVVVLHCFYSVQAHQSESSKDDCRNQQDGWLGQTSATRWMTPTCDCDTNPRLQTCVGVGKFRQCNRETFDTWTRCSRQPITDTCCLGPMLMFFCIVPPPANSQVCSHACS